MRDKGLDPLGHEAGRCLRGLRAATLRKRVSDWGPFLRYLRAHFGKVFPTEKSEVLAYFSVRAEEQAARSVYRALLSSLRFFEEAGEVPLALRLSAGQALEGAVREHERKRCQEAEAA